MSNWAFVGVAYGLTWLVLIGYTLSLRRRIRRAEARLRRVGGAGAAAGAEEAAP